MGCIWCYDKRKRECFSSKKCKKWYRQEGNFKPGPSHFQAAVNEAYNLGHYDVAIDKLASEAYHRETQGDYQMAASCYDQAAHIIKDNLKDHESKKLAKIYETKARRLDKITKNEWHGLGWRKASRLEQTASVASIIGLFGGLFFLSPNITGNVIGNINQTSSNWTGIILIIVGLISTFIYFKRKK